MTSLILKPSHPNGNNGSNYVIVFKRGPPMEWAPFGRRLTSSIFGETFGMSFSGTISFPAARATVGLFAAESTSRRSDSHSKLPLCFCDYRSQWPGTA